MTGDTLLAHPLTALTVVVMTMAGEAVVSANHERRLRAAGAVEPAGDVYAWMQAVYPAGFAACVAEGWWRGADWAGVAAVGALLFLAGKVIKYTAIVSLGWRWTFRVLPVPGMAPVRAGIYRWLRHPNYVGVLGEIVGIGVWMRAPLAGAAFLVTFLWLLRRRIHVEEQALAAAGQ